MRKILGFFKNIFNKLKRHIIIINMRYKTIARDNEGVAIIETALVLPVVLYLMFFSVEAIRLNLAITAINSISCDASLCLILDRAINENDITAIIEKHSVPGVSSQNISYRIVVYDDFTQMESDTFFGGEEISFYNKSGENDQSFVDTDNDGVCGVAKQFFYAGNNLPDKKLLTGKVFVLTCVVKFNFSSHLVGKLFNGGVNTIKSKSAKGNTFIVFGRGVGVFQD